MAETFRTVAEDEKMRANYAEYLVKRTGDRKLLLARVGIILLALTLITLGFAFIIRWMAAAMLPVVIGTAALCWYLWRFTCVEYEYIVISATVEFYKIYGERDRRKLLEIKTGDIERVAPLCDHPDVCEREYASVLDITGNKKDPVYFLTYNGEGGRGIVYFNVIKKTLDALKYYRSSAVEYGDIK